MDVCTLELRPGVRQESVSPAWLAALDIFRTLKSCFIFKYSWSFLYTIPRNPYRFINTSTYCFKLLPHCKVNQSLITSLNLSWSLSWYLPTTCYVMYVIKPENWDSISWHGMRNKLFDIDIEIGCLTSHATIFQLYMWRYIDVLADWKRSWTYCRAPNAIDIS